MRGGGEGEIELRRSAVRVPRTGHRQDSGGVVAAWIADAVALELAFDGLPRPARAVAAGIAALNDKTGRIAMKGQSVVEPLLGEFDKVCRGNGRVVLSELSDDDAFGGVEGGGSSHVLFSS